MMSFRVIPQRKKPQCPFGKHQWDTANVQGRPVLVCRRCPAFIDRRLKEKTITEQELRKEKSKPRKQRTKEDIFKEVWAKYQRQIK